MLATLDGPAYIERVSVDSVKNVRNAKKAILKAFRTQTEGGVFPCRSTVILPDELGAYSEKALEWIRENMIPYYPLGVYKDKEAGK